MKAPVSFASRLSGRIVRIISALFVSVIIILIAAGYYSMYHLTIKDCEASLQNSTLNMEKLINTVESTTESTAWLLSDVYYDYGMLSFIADNIVKTDNNILSCSIAFEPYAMEDFSKYYCHTSFRGENGRISSQIVGGKDYDYLLMDWYLIPKLLGKEYWSDPELDHNNSGKLVASFSKPLYHRDGTFYAVVKCDVAIHEFIALMEENKPFEHSMCAMIGHNSSYYTLDQTLAETETLFTVAEKMGGTNAHAIAESVLRRERGVSHLLNGKKSALVVYGPVQNGWTNILACPYYDIFETLKISNIIFLLVAFFSIVLLYYATKKTISRMSQPVTEFTYVAMSIGQGNFKTKIPQVNTRDEFMKLSESLHYMEDSIDNYIQELRKTTASNERFESELNIANHIQMQMLPGHFPVLDEIDLAASLKPAKEVGGDLYDFFVKDRRLYFIVGDVSGKGVPAALFMAITKASFRTIVDSNIPVRDMAAKINDSFCSSNESGMFVTMFFGYIDLDTLAMEYCNCGHNPIVVIDEKGNASYLNAKANLVAGLIDGFGYQSESMQLMKGMRLVIYTDGVTEAEKADKSQYGEERLLEFSRSQDPAIDSHSFIGCLEASVKDFTGDNPQNDDITMMSIRVK